MGKIRTVKKYANDGTPYYTAWLGNVVGGGDTRNEARAELIKNIDCLLDYYQREYHDSVDKNKHLETKLAETEAKLETLTNIKANELGEAFSIVVKKVADTLVQLDTSGLLELATAYCQSKIDLIEQVRTLIDCEDNYCYGDNNINIVINRDKFNEIIDDQIKEIKGEQNEYNRS